MGLGDDRIAGTESAERTGINTNHKADLWQFALSKATDDTCVSVGGGCCLRDYGMLLRTNVKWAVEIAHLHAL